MSITNESLFSAGLHAFVGVIFIMLLEGDKVKFNTSILLYFGVGMAAVALFADTLWPRISKSLY